MKTDNPKPTLGAQRPPSRAGKKPVTAYVSKDKHKQLRLLGIELDKSNQEMVTEALDMYLHHHAD